MSDVENRIASLSPEKRSLLTRQIQERRNAIEETLEQYDVVILGGGMAGLTLALQFKKTRPEASILVVEKQKYPVPEAAYKVGESTVEIASGYLRDDLGLKEHLQTQQLRKFGLRMFFTLGDNQDISRRLELGPSIFPLLHTYQLDRGRLENALADEVQRHGITFWDGCKVKQVAIRPERHYVQMLREEGTTGVLAKWVVDASGRSAVLKRQLGLTQKVAHNANAVWFRINQVIDVNQWSDDPAWHARIVEGQRSLSTNHLIGPGYWVWLIRLPSGSTSVGIVTDPTIHPFDSMNRFDRALTWLQAHEPQCARFIEQHQEDVQDFLVLKNYPYACKQVYSADRWCLTGEAGLFTDPLYSPGSDFIAISNGLICDLIDKDLDGEDIHERAVIYDQVYIRFANIWFGIYEQQYTLLGNGQVMVAKIIWDTAVYWGAFALLYFHNKFRDLGYNQALTTHLTRFSLLSNRVQSFFREWNELDQPDVTDLHVDYYAPLAFMKELHAGMAARLSDADLEERFAANVRLFERIAGQMASKVIEEYTVYAQQTGNTAMLSKIKQWLDDPFLGDLIRLHQRTISDEPLDSDWINVGHRNRLVSEIAQ